MKDWEIQYEKLVREAMEKGTAKVLKGSQEHRAQPRFSLEMGSIWIRTETPFDVVDISATGIAFLSERLFAKGQHIAMTLGKAFLVEANVVGCVMVETDPEMMEAKYRVSCEFQDSHNGTQALLMLKEMEEEARAAMHMTSPPGLVVS